MNQELKGEKPVNACVHTYTKPQTSSTRSRGLGWRIHGSVEDTKLSTNKQHSLSGWGRAVKNGLGPASAAPAHGAGTEGAGTRVYGYAIKNSGLIVEVNRQHLHVCVKEPRVKIRSPQGSGACRVS